MSTQTISQIKAKLQTTKAVLELRKAFHSSDQTKARCHFAAARLHKAKARQILSSSRHNDLQPAGQTRKILEDSSYSLRNLIMFIEQRPLITPLLFVGDKKTPIVELYDFRLAKDTLARLENLLQIETVDGT